MSSDPLTKKRYKSTSMSQLLFWGSLQQLLLVISIILLALWANASEGSKTGWPDHLDLTLTNEVHLYKDSDCLVCPEEDYYSLDCG